MMESMIMQMFNNQGKNCNPACFNQTCNAKIPRKSRKKRKHHRHCKCKKKSKCPKDDGVATIICVTKCMKKCKKNEKKSNCPNPCSDACKRMSTGKSDCPTDSSSSEANYCSKCGQPLPGSPVLDNKTSIAGYERDSMQNYAKGSSSLKENCIKCHTETTCITCGDKNSIAGHETDAMQSYAKGASSLKETCIKCHTETTCITCGDKNSIAGHETDSMQNYAKGSSSLKETCIKCHTETTCITCGDDKIIRPHQSLFNPCNFFNPDYIFGNQNDSLAGNVCDDHRRSPTIVGKFEEPEYKVPKTCSDTYKQVDKLSINKNDAPSYKNTCAATVRIKRCGHNIVTVRCGNDGDFDLSHNNVGSEVGRTDRADRICCGFAGDNNVKESQCSRRFIQITEDQRSHNGGNCITKVRCADFSSSTILTQNKGLVSDSPAKPNCSGRNSENIHVGYGPCSDRMSSVAHPNSNVVRMKCPVDDEIDDECQEAFDYEPDCEVNQDFCTCCSGRVINAPVIPYCNDPATDYYDNEFDDPPAIYDAPYEAPDPEPSPPPYPEPQAYQPVRETPSESSSSSTSLSYSDDSLPPKDRYGYDFFYGTVKPSITSDNASKIYTN